MAIIASDQQTVVDVSGIASLTPYYKLQSSTLDPPAKPTANPPAGWVSTEPSYAEGSTNSLYTCMLTVFEDGTFSYSAVSLSSSYEAAKLAYNKAVAAANAAAAAQTFKCSSNTAQATAAKAPASTVAGFVLAVGAVVSCKFTYANTSSAPTFNVNGSGAKAIMLNGANSVYWQAGANVTMIYDGTYWQIIVPALYGATSTIGNPAAGNVFTDADGVDIRNGATVLATITAALISLGVNSETSQIKLCGDKGKIGVIGDMLLLLADNVGVKGDSQALMTAADQVQAVSADGSGTGAGLSAETANSDGETAAMLYAARKAGASTLGASIQAIATDLEAYLALEGPLKAVYRGSGYTRTAQLNLGNDGNTPAESGMSAVHRPDSGTAKVAEVRTWANDAGSGAVISADEISVNGGEPFRYASGQEQRTGKKWVDGKDIWRYVLPIHDILPSSNPANVAIPFAYNQIISMSGFTEKYFALPIFYPDPGLNGQYGIAFSVLNQNLRVYTGAQAAVTYGYAIIEYTKA